MLCCAGLFGGLYVGQQLGGPWTVIAPAAGFGIGLVGDMKFMRKMHSHPQKREDEDNISRSRSFLKSKNKLPGDQGGTSEELFVSGDKYHDPP